MIPARGHKVYFIFRSSNSSKITQIYWHENRVYLIPNDKLTNNPFLKIKYYLINSYYIYRIIRKVKINIVHVRNWEFGIVIAVLFSRIYSFRTIFQKSYPREQMAVESIDYKQGFIYYLKIFRINLRYQISVYVMKLCDKIFPISKEMRNNLIQNSIPRHKMTIIPYGSIVPPKTNYLELEDLRKNLAINGKIVFLYFGASEKLRKIEFIIDAFKRVNIEKPSTILILLGAEPKDLNRLDQYIALNNLHNSVRLIGKIPRNEVVKYISISDITLSIIPPLKFYQVSTPAKLIESMVLGKPTIANNLPFQQKILKESKGGICIEYNLKELANSMIYLSNHPHEVSKMGKSGKDYIINNLSFDLIVDKMIGVYESF
tara:strand:- start:613 stop:1734 length:1122 start_codon:yes stop_codon:yes gene_type:complete